MWGISAPVGEFLDVSFPRRDCGCVWMCGSGLASSHPVPLIHIATSLCVWHAALSPALSHYPQSRPPLWLMLWMATALLHSLHSASKEKSNFYTTGLVIFFVPFLPPFLPLQLLPSLSTFTTIFFPSFCSILLPSFPVMKAASLQWSPPEMLLLKNSASGNQERYERQH